MDKEILTDEQFEAMVDEAAQENRATIVIIRDKDGNWRGAYAKEGIKTIEDKKSMFARQSDPQTVLQLLLTHDGKPYTKTE